MSPQESPINPGEGFRPLTLGETIRTGDVCRTSAGPIEFFPSCAIGQIVDEEDAGYYFRPIGTPTKAPQEPEGVIYHAPAGTGKTFCGLDVSAVGITNHTDCPACKATQATESTSPAPSDSELIDAFESAKEISFPPTDDDEGQGTQYLLKARGDLLVRFAALRSSLIQAREALEKTRSAAYDLINALAVPLDLELVDPDPKVGDWFGVVDKKITALRCAMDPALSFLDGKALEVGK